MQKDGFLTNAEDTAAKGTTPENINDTGGSTNEAEAGLQPGENNGCDAGSKEEFERLIKGPYKEAFNSRVQGIINQRFKEKKKAEAEAEKTADSKAAEQKQSTQMEEAAKDSGQDFSPTAPVLMTRAAELVAMGYSSFDLSRELENPTFKALLKGGVDMLTAYQAIHFEEIMDSSVRFGAETAAKQMADSIRFKAGRPGENGLLESAGFGTRRGVSSLTPEKRRDLARKAMMGEKISF